MHSHTGKFFHLPVLRKRSESSSLMGIKDHTSFQANALEVGKVTGGLMASLKPLLSVGPFAEWESQKILFSDWLMLMELSQRSCDQKRSENVFHN
ncbi:8.2 kDa differentiation factor [Microtus ochrogaster]|uniref:8.2 kDa differentiation factor n=1 Tax=Microtus ochrogaster TaxID=79684 RepID=A0A8J6GMW1_MICOH|nr:8.2 kDa differentiation factor [Microtus ochrogaster]